MLLALDRGSVRTFDPDGHLHVASSNISAGGVSQYVGTEIVDWERLGLNPSAVYNVLRPPEELAKAASTFQGKPLTSQHRPQTADDHSHGLVVGSVNNPVWQDPYLVAELSIWDSAAIRSIQDGSKKSLSAGYRYTPVLQSGVYQGTPYTLKMTDISGNHVSLVDEPRVKAAFVGDALPSSLRKSQSQPPRIIFTMDDDTTDPVERCCAILRETKMPESNIAKVRAHLARMLDQGASEGEENGPIAAMDRASLEASNEIYIRRFPNARRLA